MIYAERFLLGSLAALGDCVFDNLLLRRCEGLDLVEEAFHGGGVTIRANKSVERLDQMPDGAFDLCLQAGVNVVFRAATPLFAGRDELQFDDTFGAEVDLHRTIES